jgi:hypothetical protein
MRVFGGTMVVAGAIWAGLSATPARADVEAGVKAWQAGDYAAAVREWRPLADKGDADAQYNLGQAYRFGMGVPKDLAITRSWLQKAAQQGHEHAQNGLGLLLFDTGKRAEAMPWIRKSAARGDPRAQYVLGTAMFNGDFAPKDLPRAYALMTRAASRGLPVAADTLTQMDGLIPLADRQKGIALARQMESGAAPAPTRMASSSNAVRAVTPPAKPAPAAKPAQAAARPSAAGSGWRVQLGAYGSPAAAQGQWATLSRKIGGMASLQPSYEAAGKFTRLRAGPLASRAAADKVCASAKAAGQACFPVAP